MVSRGFPVTRISVIEGLSSNDPATRQSAADLLARAYWQPILTTLRTRWNLELHDAEDLTQEFLAEAFLKEWLVKFDPAKARFRTFLRMCLDRFAANAAQARDRLKRGGAAQIVALDDDLPIASNDPGADEQFRQEWVRSVFTLALDALRSQAASEGKSVHVDVFQAYDVEDSGQERPSYRELAAKHGLPETTITNHLAWARRAFRQHVLDVLRALAGSEAEFRDDARELLGASVE